MDNTAKTRQFVVNFHINQICNFNCGYCYSDWGLTANRNDVFRSASARERVISELWSLLSTPFGNNPSSARPQWERVRLNFAGGEPLLYEAEVLAGVKYARALGFDLSIITNGSRLTVGLTRQLAPDLEWLGISIDSINSSTNARIGRMDQRYQQLNLEQVAEAISAARAENPSLKIKLNTVVNTHNSQEDLSSFIEEIAPEKWKVFQALPTTTNALSISKDAFAAFVKRHARFQQIMRVENNDSMIGSYLMVDPMGRFYDNSVALSTQEYRYSDPIHKVGAKKAFSQITFDEDAFASRYATDRYSSEARL